MKKITVEGASNILANELKEYTFDIFISDYQNAYYNVIKKDDDFFMFNILITLNDEEDICYEEEVDYTFSIKNYQFDNKLFYDNVVLPMRELLEKRRLIWKIYQQKTMGD